MRFLRVGLLFLTAFLSACTAAQNPLSPAPAALPTETPLSLPTETPLPLPPATATNGSSCGRGACVRQAFIQNDGENLSFFFDLTSPGGSIDRQNPPQFLGNLLVGSYYLKADGSEEFLVGAELAPDRYSCYAGDDLPWMNGEFGAVCAFNILLEEMETYKPQVGDQVRLDLPGYSNFSQVVTVQSGE